MKMNRLLKNQRGQSTIEVLMVVAILAVAAQSTTLMLRLATRSNVADRDRAFATEKALQMLEELRSEVLDEKSQVAVLDLFDDGKLTSAPFTPNFKYTLTTEVNITKPGGVQQLDTATGVHPLSANPVRANGYAFVRTINVTVNLLDPNIRTLRVRVYPAAANAGTSELGAPLPKGGPAMRPLAEVLGTVRSLGTVDRPAQSVDFFLVAMENVPGWWSRTSNLIPIMQAGLISMQARNPGLKINQHWVNRLSFGRDLEYTPEINQAVRSDASGAFKKTYVLPGLINYSNGDDEYYMVSHIEARINVDGVIDTRMGYAMADQWNHAMRLPDEENLFNILTNIAANKGEQAPEMSLRLLLDRMNRNDASVRNAIVVNLHGEMLPLVPLRNYSDAAKDPIWSQGLATPRNWRVVSHFERLGYNSGIAGQANQNLRVYAYDMNPPADPITVANENDIIKEVTVFIPGADISNLAAVQRIRGGSKEPYKAHNFNSSNWMTGTATAWDAGVSPTTWVADTYTPPGRVEGLRIRLLGVTPTARAYNGPEYSYYYAN